MKMRSILTLFIALTVVGLSGCRSVEKAKRPMVGTFSIAGWESETKTEKPDYTGQATITNDGKTFYFEGVVDNEKYKGRGLLDPISGDISFCYRSLGKSNAIGCALFHPTCDGFQVKWRDIDASKGGGEEKWKRIAQP